MPVASWRDWPNDAWQESNLRIEGSTSLVRRLRWHASTKLCYLLKHVLKQHLAVLFQMGHICWIRNTEDHRLGKENWPLAHFLTILSVDYQEPLLTILVDICLEHVAFLLNLQVWLLRRQWIVHAGGISFDGLLVSRISASITRW